LIVYTLNSRQECTLRSREVHSWMLGVYILDDWEDTLLAVVELLNQGDRAWRWFRKLH
jgi:hypothetical protein